MGLTHFGTDGIRGAYGSAALNEAVACRVGVALGRLLKDRSGSDCPLLVIGRDTRASGVKLLSALATGFESEGGRVESLGIVPSPAVAWAVVRKKAAAGCSITASHNPSGDNGLKFFQSNGSKLSEAFEIAFDDAIDAAALPESHDERSIDDLHGGWGRHYADCIRGLFPEGLLKGKRIAVDCANGAMSGIAVELFESFGANVDAVGSCPDGENINAGVGSEYPEAIQDLYRRGDYDMGFAFDGDGDRVAVFDEAGDKLRGEAVLGLLALRSKEKGMLQSNTLVTTAQSNLGLDVALKRLGIATRRVAIGDKHVARLMTEEGYSLGGEESGHVVYCDNVITGDGLFAAMKVAEASIETGRGLKDLASFYEAYPQECRNIPVEDKRPLSELPRLSAILPQLELEMGEAGRLQVRYSGTEPILRLLVEAKTAALVGDVMKRLEEAVLEDRQRGNVESE